MTIRKAVTIRLDAVLLMTVGLGTGWFSLSANYGLLMHPKFQWLSLAGALLVLAMGMSALLSPRRGHISGTASFLLLLGIVVLGKPFTRTTASSGLLAPPAPEALDIDEQRFPFKEIRELHTAAKKGQALDGVPFSALGTLQRITLPDGRPQTVLMRSYMACCAADALALGFRLTHDLETTFQEGDWVVISGTLSQLHAPDPLPSFRMGTATFATVHEAYVMEPTQIVSYTTILPSVIEQLTSPSTALFTQALQATDLWGLLQGEGPFTVFAPMNEAFEQESPSRDWLAQHIVLGRLTDKDLYEEMDLNTVHGRKLTIQAENGRLRVEGARLVFKNKLARNGVVHIIYPCLDVEKETP